MRLKLFKSNGREYIQCPKNGMRYYTPHCRENCELFNGYKTVKGERKLLCKYKKK